MGNLHIIAISGAPHVDNPVFIADRDSGGDLLPSFNKDAGEGTAEEGTCLGETLGAATRPAQRVPATYPEDSLSPVAGSALQANACAPACRLRPRSRPPGRRQHREHPAARVGEQDCAGVLGHRQVVPVGRGPSALSK